METTYIEAKEAMQILDLPSTTFYREVDAGNIPYVIAKGRKRGMLFPKEAIEIHAHMRRKSKKKALHLAFARATNVDIWTAIENTRRIYGEEDTIPYRKVLEMREVNDEMTMCIKEDGEFAGCTTFMPLDERIIHDLLQNKIRERQIPNRAIKQWTDPKLSVYIASIAVIASGEIDLDTERGMFLLRHTIKRVITLSHQYDIKNWYAIGATPVGQSILERLGFKEIVSLENGERKGYFLDNWHSSRLIHAFMANMEQQDLLLSDQRTTFMQGTFDDIAEEFQLSTLLFGNEVNSISTLHAWLAKNPHIHFIVRDKKNLAGHMHVLPVRHETIMRFIRGEIRGWEITPEDILPYTPGSKVECIIKSMITSPEANPKRRVHYGQRLISGFVRFIRELAEQDVMITKFYAISATPTGIAILRNAGFKEIGQTGKRIAFVLDVMTSESPLAMAYREALKKA